MSIIRPFKGIRPATDLAASIAALPYDVYSSKEAREIVSSNPMSFLKIDRAETLLPEGTDLYSPEVYQTARRTLKRGGPYSSRRCLQRPDRTDFSCIPAI